MPPTLKITALGRLIITLNDKPLPPFASRKADALLVYLACTGRLHPRIKLGSMLWNDRSTARSLSNLSVLLTSLRKHLSSFLLVDRQSVGLQSNTHFWVDVSSFENQIKKANSIKKTSGEFGQDAAGHLEAALMYYQGGFLDGFHIREARDFEEWVILERERLQHLALKALFNLVQYYLHAGKYRDGLRHATHLLRLDPFREGTHRQIMLLWARLGQRHKALEQYKQCKKILAKELDIAPSPTTDKLYQRIRSAWSPRVHIPRQTTPFIGREAELASISERLSNPECRLLTLLGPGGIGKTRLALQAATINQHLFLNGVVFTSLESLTDPELVPSVLAETLGFTLMRNESPANQLIHYLSNKEILLVLDNFEHLLPTTRLLDQILRRTPDVKILTTSRERLKMLSEWLIEVRGLQYPQKAQDGVENSDAIQLFVKSAQRVQTNFELGSENIPSVMSVCQTVDGSPLGIELAASWMRELNPQEIAAETKRELDFLKAPLCDIPDRHHSLCAVFDYSWNMLNSREQEIFRCLSVFRGAFSKEAAQEITSSSLRTLSRLMDKSLLHQQEGRYRIHGLLRQYATEKLNSTPQKKNALKEQFVVYYTDFLHHQSRYLESTQHNETVHLIAQDFENIRLAWQLASSNQNYRALERTLKGLYHFLRIKSRFQEGLDLLSNTLENWDESQKNTRLFGKILARQGAFLQFLGEPAATGIMQQSLEYAHHYDDPDEQVFCLVMLANTLRRQGDWDQVNRLAKQVLETSENTENIWGMTQAYFLLGQFVLANGQLEAAGKLFKKGVTISRKSQNPRLPIILLNSLGDISAYQGDYAEAQELFEECLALSRQFGDRYREAIQLNNLGTLLNDQGKNEQAKSCYEDSLDICRQIGDITGQVFALSNLGEIALQQNDIITARSFCERSLALARQLRNQYMVAANLRNMGEIETVTGDTAQAEKHLKSALQTSDEMKDTPLSLTILLRIAELHLHKDEQEQAKPLLQITAQHPASEQPVAEKAVQLIEDYDGTFTSAPPLTLDEIIKAVLD